MSKVKVRHNPGLTVEQAMQIFRSHFGGKYEIYRIKVRRGLFMIKKSALTGVRMRLIQTKDATHFDLGGDVPSLALRILLFFCVLIPALWPALFVFWLIWNNRCFKPLRSEVKQFIAAAPEFT